MDLSQSLEKLSTRIDFETLGLEEAARTEKECFKIQIKGTEDKQRAGRRAGALLNKLEDEKGPKVKKEILPTLGASAADAKKWQKDAEVPNKDYERYVEEVRKKSKELTNSGLRRAGKERIKTGVLSAAGRVLKSLNRWVDSSLLLSVSRKEYVGSIEEIEQVAALLEKLSNQFLVYSKTIRKQ